MEDDAVSALLGSSLQHDTFGCHQSTTSERNRGAAMQMDSSVGSDDRDLRSKSALKAVKLKIIATDELIRKFIELKHRHEKLYRMYRYQEKLIADLEETNRDHLKDKDLLKEKLAVEKAGNQGFENTITQFVARLEEAEQKKEAAQTEAKEAEETVTQLKKELLEKSKKIERLEKRLDSAKLLGPSARARCGKGGREIRLSAAECGITEGTTSPHSCEYQMSSEMTATPVGVSSEEAEDCDAFIDVLDEVPSESAPAEVQRQSTTATADIESRLSDTSEERHHPVCLPERDGAALINGPLREHVVADAEGQMRKKGQRKKRATAKHSTPTELPTKEVKAVKHDTSTVTDSGISGSVKHKPEPLCDMPMLAVNRPQQLLSSTPASHSPCVGSLTPMSPCSQESCDAQMEESTPCASDYRVLHSAGSGKDEVGEDVPKCAAKQKRSRRLAFRTHRMLLRNRTASVLEDVAELIKFATEEETSDGDTSTPSLQHAALEEELCVATNPHNMPTSRADTLVEDECSDVSPLEASQDERVAERGTQGASRRRRPAGRSKRGRNTPKRTMIVHGPPTEDGALHQQNVDQQEVVEGQQEVAEGGNELVEGQQEVAEGGNELVEGQQEVAEGGNELVEGQQEVAEGGNELVEGQQEVAEGNELTEGQQEVVEGDNEGHQEVAEAMCINPLGPYKEHCNGMAALMGDFQLSDGSSDEEGESPVEGSGSAPSGDLPLQEEVKVCGSDSEGDTDSGLATGSAAPSIVSEVGPSPSVGEYEIGMEMETDEVPKTDRNFLLGCSRDEYRSDGPNLVDCKDPEQSDNCDSEMAELKKSDRSATSFEQASDLPPPPPTQFGRYSLQEIFASMLPLGRLSPIPPDPTPGLDWSEEEAGETQVSLPCPSGSNKKDATRSPSHRSKDSCAHVPQHSSSSVCLAQEDTSKHSGASPSAPPCSPQMRVPGSSARVQCRKARKKDSVLSPLLSRQPVAGHPASPPVRPSSAAQALSRLSTRDILLSSCNRESPSQLPPWSSLESRSGKGRHKGKMAVGRLVVPKGGTSCFTKAWTDSPPMGKQQPSTEFEAESSAATMENCRVDGGSTVVVSLLQSGGGRCDLPQSGGGRCDLPQSGGGRGVPLMPREPEAEEDLMCSALEHHCVEEDGKGPFPTSSDATTRAVAPSCPAATDGPACREVVPTEGVTPTVGTSVATVETGMGEASIDVGSASGPKDIAVVTKSAPSGSSKMADKGEEEMEDGELGSSDEEDASPPRDQVCASRVSLDQATGSMAIGSSLAGEEGSSRGPPTQALEGVGSKRGTSPQLLEDCNTTPGPSAKKQKLLGPPTEAFAVVAWLDPLVSWGSSSSGKATFAKKGGVAVRRGKGQTESNYVQSVLQLLERGEVGVCEVYSLLTKENNVKSRKKLIAGFQLCLYHYKPSWAKLQQMLKNKLDTISSLTIGKTKDTRPLTPQEDPNSTEFLPCLLPFEAQLVWLVLQLSCYYGNQANKGGVNGQKGLYLVEFKELLYTMITKESKRFHLKCALIRLYVSCCRLLQGTREHVQLLSCELLSSCEPLMERRLPMIQSIACVWPLALTKPKDHHTMRNGRYIPSVLEQHMLAHVPELVVVHTFWKDNPNLFTNMVFKSLFLLCHWRQNNPDSLKAMALGLVGVLHCSSNVTMVTPPARGSWVRPQLSITGTRTINLLHLACRTIGWKWTSDVLIRTQLWPLLQSWNKKDSNAIKEATLVGICTFFGMIGPLGVEYDTSAGPGSNCLQLLQKVLVSLIVKATTGQDREMSLAVQLTIADSLLALCPPGSAMATEAGSALTTWLQHNAKRHTWFSATVGQQYLYAVQQIAASPHRFVQFNEPTY